jgi:hypothetical protein
MSRILKAAEAVVAARFSPNQSWDALKESIAELADAIHQTGEEAAKAPKEDGGPAFPVPPDQVSTTGDPRDGMAVCAAGTGMTLRDWFAGMSMQASIIRNKSDLARCAYEVADAMLAARKEVA